MFLAPLTYRQPAAPAGLHPPAPFCQPLLPVDFLYEDFLHRHAGAHILYFELGVGGNTPVIIKFPFWRMTYQNLKAVYACVNLSEAYCPKEIQKRSICIDGDIGKVLTLLCL